MVRTEEQLVEHSGAVPRIQNLEHRDAYEDRIFGVCEYIESHLQDELSVERLSEIANFSKFHFHRQFANVAGVTVFKFVQLLRLKRASYQLVYYPEMSVLEIALEASFSSPESFARTFKKEFGQTPSGFRAEPHWKPWHEKYKFPRRGVLRTMNVEIVEFQETPVAVLEHRGAPELINDSVSQFIAWRKAAGLSPVDKCRTFGVLFDDPKVTKPEDFRFDICGAFDHLNPKLVEVPKNEFDVVNKVIPGGLCAKIRHLGSHDAMDEKVHYLYGEWLPESGRELRDFPCYVDYQNFFPEVSESELVTDIYLPIQ